MGSATIEDINELEGLKSDLTKKKEGWNKISESYRKVTEEEIPTLEKSFRDNAWNRILKANECITLPTV